jgi:menaquinone-dependent protoporphyrinogen oxidase
MNHRTLVAYASRAGSTAEVAKTVGAVLREHGIDADVRPVKDVADVVGYDSVVFGSAIWAGKPLPEMLRFVKRHRDAITQLPVAYFIQCDQLRAYTPANRQIALGYVTPLRKLHEPVNIGLFAGRRDFSTVNPLVKWVLMHVFKLSEGDWRDWEQIKVWAATVAGQVVQTGSGRLERGAA